MPPVVSAVVYLLFFLSGAAALIYQVVWVRSLTLVFGGSHLAVTAVLSIFMGGLAIGGHVVGRYVDQAKKPLRLYALLELGIAASALLFIGLMKAYPAMYVTLARGRDDATLYLTIVRMLFSVAALIVPTILMGGTLPVLSRFVSRQPDALRSHLPFLYGLNTLGAVVGALLASFVLLRVSTVSTTLYIAIATNAIIGFVSLALQGHAGEFVPAAPTTRRDAAAGSHDIGVAASPLSIRLVLWGIGVSGFCALGYEVLWSRILTLAVGASVYGFTIMLVAFLTGIAAGSEGYGLLVTVFKKAHPSTKTIVAWFGVVQVAIGVSALLVTVFIRDIPINAVRLQSYFAGTELGSFQARIWANFVLAFLYLVVPAVFMGAAFPLAGEAVARHRRSVGRGVGDVLASNTLGAIVGAAASGLLMIGLLGIERSLEILAVINIGLGLLVLVSVRPARWAAAAVATCSVAVIAFLAVNRDAMKAWDPKYFAVFRNNQPEAFSTPDMVREAVDNTDVLFYAEGTESIVSAIRIKGGEQAFVTNGRVEASTHPRELQTQLTLGHLPMLLNREPREVLVVGLGTGMTAGAAAVHPGVQRVTVVEIEDKVLGVARTFEQYNHHVLDNGKVDFVLNDGRNFLMTTDRRFDVITADPIHPWFRGAGYLYASEYFQLAAEHLRPGGVIAQWLPIYELTPRDLASVVRTFQQHFPHAVLWLTHYDAVIVGSRSPFLIDEAQIEKRIAEPAIAGDLRKVTMGSATDLLSYFVMGTEAMKRFGQSGTLNTDDRLYLEFSAPFSIATPDVMAANVAALAAHRESLLPYLEPAADMQRRAEQRERWAGQLAAGRLGDRALALFLVGGASNPAFVPSLRRLNLEYPWYAPGRFLDAEYEAAVALEPRLLQQASFTLLNENGAAVALELSAVLVPVSATRCSIMFVDNRARVIYGQAYVDDCTRNNRASRISEVVMAAIRSTYENEAVAARAQRQALPAATQTLPKIKAVIGSQVDRVQHQS